jgi:uncharacterized protein YcbK (DUF882 family)
MRAFPLLLLLVPAISFGEVEHVVSKGHTLGSIARRYHVSVDALADRNHLERRARVAPGDVLVVPTKDGKKIENDKTAAKAEADKKAEAEKKAAAENKAEADKKAAAEKKAEAEKKEKLEKAAEKEKKEKTKAKHYAGRPENPGVIKVRRLATNEDFSVKVNTRGKTPHDAAKKVAWMMRSPSGVTHEIDPRLMSLLGTVSDHFAGRKIEIISGYRPFTPKQYTPHSRHNHGKAVDFRVIGVPHEAVRDFCRTLHNTGCGYYPNSVFVHMDARDASAYWIDYSKPGEAPRYHGNGHHHADEGTSDVHADHNLDPKKADESEAAPAAAASAAEPKVELPAPSPGAPSAP